MLTDSEVEALAHSIVKEGLEFVKEQQPQLFKIVTSRSGELGFEFAVRGKGSFYCVYYPFVAIKPTPEYSFQIDISNCPGV